MPDTALTERQRAILARLDREGSVVVAELARVLGVSDVTIRKDLHELERLSLLRRVHGGAELAHRSKWNPSIGTRLDRHPGAKAAIARAALAFVHDGDTVLLDAGTSTLALARRLRGGPGSLTVVTNSVPIVAELAQHDDIEVVALGGLVRGHSLAMIGPLTVAALARVHADVAFLGATGVSPRRGLCTPNLIEAETKAAMVRSADRCVALVDASKLAGASLAPFCAWAELAALITDRPVPPPLADVLHEHGVRVIVAAAPADGSPLAPEEDA